MDNSAAKSTLGKYRLIAKLGRGGMADVYLAVVHGPVGFTKLQVIKQLNEELADSDDFVGMFLDEARLAALLNHPNVVQTNEVGQSGGAYFIAMEYLEGQTLRKTLSRARHTGTRIPLELHLRIVADVLAGLHYAHEMRDLSGKPLNIVHRDVSPHNIFLTYDGEIKVVDFGIAKAASSSADTKAGILKGKVSYMAPEQAQAIAVDRRADIFQVGIVLWESITGRRYWPALGDMDILQRLMAGVLPSLDKAPHEIVPPLRAICTRALAEKPQDRYASAEDFREAIEHFMTQHGMSTPARAVGSLVADLFRDTRTSLRFKIEERLALMNEPATTGFEEANGLNLMTLTGSFSESPDSMRPPGDPNGLMPTSGTLLNSSLLGSSSGSTVMEPHGRQSPGVPTRHVYAVGGGLLAAAIFLGLYSTLRSPVSSPISVAAQEAVAAQYSASSSPVEAPPSTDTRRETIDLSVECTPSSATLYLDDAPLPSNPFAGKFPKDDVMHRIRAEAEGYVSMATVIAFDQGRHVACNLHPQRGRPVAGRGPSRTREADPKAVPQVSASPMASSQAKGHKGSKLLKLDDIDPWSNQ